MPASMIPARQPRRTLPAMLRLVPPLMAALLLAVAAVPAVRAGPDGPPGADRRGDWRGDWRGEGRGDWRAEAPRRDGWDGGPRPQPPGQARAPEREFHGRGPERRYPAPDVVVRVPPPRAVVVPWRGTGYRFHEGVWYAPAPQGWRVVRAPHGAVVPWLPVFRTVVVVGGLSYLLLNDTWYRERADGGYEVVAPPPDAPPAPPERLYIYPARGQSPQVQAADEYDCHRWAARQSGYDPTAQATGVAVGASAAQRDDYRRAQTACLEGRGYTVK